MKQSKSQEQMARELVMTQGQHLDLDRKYSHGIGGAQSFIDETMGGITASWRIANTGNTQCRVLIGHLNNTQYDSQAALLAAMDADILLTDGAQDHATGSLTGTSLDGGRLISGLLRHASKAPTRIVAANFKSSKTDGSADNDNFAGSIKTAFASPFRSKIKEEFLQLAQFQGSDKFNPQYLKIDFTKQKFPVIFSSETFTVLTVQPGTKLDITFTIGLQNSAAQVLYRDAKKADNALAYLK